MTTNSAPHILSDRALLVETERAAANERSATGRLIELLSEVDARRLYLGQGCASLFTYCTQILHLSEHAAYGRIEAARAARRFPLVLERLVSGELTLSAIGLLRPHLNADNHRELLNAGRHKSKRQIEELVARLSPQSPAPSMVRKLPTTVARQESGSTREDPIIPPAAASTSEASREVTAPAPRPALPVVRPLAPELYRVQVTISADTRAKLRQVQDLLRHRNPNGDVAVIFDRAVTMLLQHLERTKLAATQRPRGEQEGPRTGSRHIPASVKREVWARDSGRCAFVGARGRCTETGFLEFHHVEPFARCGPTTATNLELRCRSHNGYEAMLYFGSDVPHARERAPASAW